MTQQPDPVPQLRITRPAAPAPPTWRRWVPALVGAVAIGLHLVMGVPYAVPIIALLSWVAVVTAGAAWLDWTA